MSMEILTLFAILVGPISAIFVARYLDARRDERFRKMDIFRTLMRTRRTPIYPEHVGALNLIEIEFAKETEVISAWKVLMNHFADSHARYPNEQPPQQPAQKQTDDCDKIFHDRLHGERQKLLAKLLHAIAKSLGFEVEQLEIFEGGYTPQGWYNTEAEQQEIRNFVLELRSGRRVVPVGIFNTQPQIEDKSVPPTVSS